MEKVKILVTLGSLGVGGNEKFAMNLFHHIDKQKFQMDFAVFDSSRTDYLDEVIRGGGRVFFCESNKKGKLRQLLEQRSLVCRILRDEKYNIIHCNSCSFFGLLPGVLAGHSNGIKVIAHSHNAGQEKNTLLDKTVRRFLKELLCRSIDYGFSCSDVAGKSKFTEDFMSSNRYKIINNAIEVDDYQYKTEDRETIRKEFGLKDGDFVVGHVGRFEEQKNHLFLIDIFQKIKELEPDSKLLLVGNGSLFEICKEKAEQLEGGHIIFAGQRSDVSRIYNAMDCFVLPSFYEGFPFVLVEAQINGLPCFVSDTVSRSVDISESVRFISIKENAEEWAEQICKHGRQRLSDQQIQKVQNEYDLKKETRKIENYYAELRRERGRHRT